MNTDDIQQDMFAVFLIDFEKLDDSETR